MNTELNLHFSGKVIPPISFSLLLEIAWELQIALIYFSNSFFLKINISKYNK